VTGHEALLTPLTEEELTDKEDLIVGYRPSRPQPVALPSRVRRGSGSP
jgi:hypothetical protein